MDRISMTVFADFVLSSGTAKLSVVHDMKKDRGDHDFYRPLREAIVEMHKTGVGGGEHLDKLIASLDDDRKRRIYPAIVTGYRKFLDVARPIWFNPPMTACPIGGIEVNVNPELGLVIDGTRHVIKLHMRGEKLTAKRAMVVLNLLTSSAFGATVPGCVFAMLDVRKAKLHTLKAPNHRLSLLLRGEAAAFSTIYAAL